MTKEGKEERSEFLTMYVTPSVKKEFELLKDSKTLQETILRNYLTNHKDWLGDELKEIDESTVKYSAKLIGTKDAFDKCQALHEKEIEKIYDRANETFKKLNNITESTTRSIEMTSHNLENMLKAIAKIDYYKIEKILEIVNKVNSMSDSERMLMEKLFKY